MVSTLRGGLNGVYVVDGHDAEGPWFYTGKGDPTRAAASCKRHGGDHVRMISVGLTDDEAFAHETTAMRALEAAGVRVKNIRGGHGSSATTPAQIAARFFGQASVGQVLTPDALSAACGEGALVQVSVNWVRGSDFNESGLRREAYRVWSVSEEAVRVIRSMLARGIPVRLLGVGAGGVILGVWRIISVTKDRWEPDLRYFGLAPDVHASSVAVGKISSMRRQNGVRYAAPSGVTGKPAFVAA